MKNLKEILEKNEAIIFPTDTVYGLGVLPKKEALEKIYSIKNRERNKKIVALVSTKEKAKEILEKNDLVYDIVDKYFPGEITIISKASKKYFDLLGYDNIGVRMPNNKKTLEILDSVGGVLMTTSANISGEEAPSKFNNISKKILDKVSCYIEKDEGLSGKASSIYMIENNKIITIRDGNVKL